MSQGNIHYEKENNESLQRKTENYENDTIKTHIYRNTNKIKIQVTLITYIYFKKKDKPRKFLMKTFIETRGKTERGGV